MDVLEWGITENELNMKEKDRLATLFFQGNGFWGMRGGFEEGTWPERAVYINGLYETSPIQHPESAYGLAKQTQTMIPLPDAGVVRLFVNDDPFDLNFGQLHEYRRCIDFREGILCRTLKWTSPSGVTIRLNIRRIISHHDPQIGCIQCTVEVVSGTDVDINFCSAIALPHDGLRECNDPRVSRKLAHQVFLPQNTFRENGIVAATFSVKNSGCNFTCGMSHRSEGHPPAEQPLFRPTEGGWELLYSFRAAAGSTMSFLKHIFYSDSAEVDSCVRKLRSLASLDFEFLLAQQKEYLARFWQSSDVVLEGDARLQQSVRFALYSLLQSAGRDGRRNIASKGLSGEGYEGHYFWDTEIYVLPVFIYTRPDIARQLLLYRYHTLDSARKRAEELSLKGALFPWRTICGEEASAYFPAGTAQYHINADIAYAIRKYVDASTDLDFLWLYGAEMVFEMARMWRALGFFCKKKGFCINCVTGPDEYTALVNNNCYTNMMARFHFKYAAEVYERMACDAKALCQALCAKINLIPTEVQQWREAAEKMYIPYDQKLGFHKQDDSFLDKEVWDVNSIPSTKRPLLLHYHPLNIYRRQILKQPDVVLAQFLLHDDFSRANKFRNFHYYEKLTTGDSSLSACIQCVAASELGLGRAFSYFMETARMDLDNISGNTRDGIHTAAMAGTWIALVYGFLGMRESSSMLSFCPHLPPAWRRLQLPLRFRGCLILITLTHNDVVYVLQEGNEITIKHYWQEFTLSPAQRDVCLSVVPSICAILFDLDGVITDTAEHHYSAWKKLCDEMGIPFNRDVNEELRGVGRRDSFLKILSCAGTELSDIEVERAISKKNEYYVKLLDNISENDLLPGVKSFVCDVRASGIKTALVSASRNAPKVLASLNITEWFDTIIDPATIAVGKPDPELFFSAADALRVPCRYCVGIEDAAAGIEAIKGAGMYAVGIGAAACAADLPLKDTAQLSLRKLKDEFLAAKHHYNSLEAASI